jgi:maltooligosyltrehalose trehalohydrolase
MTRFLSATCSQPQPECLDVTWRFAAGILRFLANFGEVAAEIELGEHGHVLWSSPGAVRDGDRARLHPWTGLFLAVPPR